MKRQSRYRGMMSFDALFSLVPLLLMFVFLLDMMSFIGHDLEERSQRQDVFDKLVSIADYTVKSGAVKKDGDIRYPNWIEGEELTDAYAEDLREKSGLSRLYISFDEDNDYPICIYRIVVTGEQKEVGRLFVCGG